MSKYGWYGCDLDGCLAFYDGWKGVEHIGHPIPLMVQRIKDHLAKGDVVKIFTARVSVKNPAEKQRVIDIIQEWTEQHIGQRLEVTNEKDFGMIVLYDDRCRQVEENTGVLK